MNGFWSGSVKKRKSRTTELSKDQNVHPETKMNLSSCRYIDEKVLIRKDKGDQKAPNEQDLFECKAVVA